MSLLDTQHGVTWTVDELLEEVRDEAAIPTSSRFTPAKILAFADMAIRSAMTEPVVTNLGLAGRWLDYEDLFVSGATHNGREYFVPARAASGTVSHVEYYADVDNGPKRLHAISAAEAYQVAPVSRDATDAPEYWSFRDGRIVLSQELPDNQGNNFIRVWFPRAHPKLVTTDQSLRFYEYDSVNDRFYFQGPDLPAPWPDNESEYLVDVYMAWSPHATICTRVRISNTTPTLDAVGGVLSRYYVPAFATEDQEELLSKVGPAAGNRPGPARAALSGTSNCVQLPDVMRKGLTSRIASYILRTIGDEARANSLWGVSREELSVSQNSMQPRQKADKIVHINRHSPLRLRRTRRGYWGW